MFKKIKMRLTWMNAISYFIFLVLFLTVFYMSFAQILNKVQENMVESYAANNTDKFFNIYNGPPKPPNRFELEVDQVSFFYVISKDLEILYGEELHEGFNEVLQQNLKPVETKQFERYEYEDETLLVMTQAVRIQGDTLGYIAVGQNVTTYAELLQNVLILLVMLLIVSSIGIALLSYFLAKKSMTPIQISYEQQRQFVANASHELRTPLAVLYSSLELFEEQLKQKGTEYPSDTMDDMKNEANYMNDMLSSLLTLTRSDQNQIRLNIRDVDLSNVLIQRTRRFAKTVQHLAFQLEIDDEITIQADPILVEELLYILLKNAVTYTNEGTVTVRAYTEANNVKIEVADTGIGIAEGDLPHIFERFYRADKIRNKSGTGLGLAIAKVITDLHGGQITVKSGLGKGTIFTIEFPLLQK
ncbi:sensor histidine kinase [Solibacillus silvestris]|uniref:sensor histidine kinase n=1 Tax=Solibacillus silvestris TaxID=76853 RepID=UPI003F7DA492